MKNYLITGVLAFLSVTTLNAQSKWNMGVQTGCVTNLSKFESGDETANALFSNIPSKSFNLGVNVKYKISEKFSFQTGLSFTEIGFSYAMAKDYSLLKPFERSEDLSATTHIANIPAMVLLNTPLNCSNVRFVFGAGVSVRGINSNWNQDDIEEVRADEGGNTANTFLTAESKTKASVSPALTWQIGVEKVMSKGNSLSFLFTGNQGLNTIATSTVNYTADDKNYTHTFINRGSFVNLAIAYNFMSFGSRKAAKAAK